MTRIALGIEYDGSTAHGWQYQSHDPNTLQQAVESALSQVADHPVRVICSGRTDAGVHACQQVVHFDSEAVRSERAWVLGSNRYLPPTISIQWAKPISDDFHARFVAKARRYRYLIYNSSVRQALLSRQLTWFHHPLDADRMHQAAQSLVGTHDFTSYRAVACQAKQPVRTIESVRVTRKGAVVAIDIKANGFLQHMVRNITGVLLPIGQGLSEIGWAQAVLEAKDRRVGGVTAPPYGLYFVGPEYDDIFDIPQLEIPIPVMPF